MGWNLTNEIGSIFERSPRLAWQAESAFQVLYAITKDRARLEKASDDFRDNVLADIAALAQKFATSWTSAEPKPLGEALGSPSSPAIGESSPVKADAPKNAAVGGKI